MNGEKAVYVVMFEASDDAAAGAVAYRLQPTACLRRAPSLRAAEKFDVKLQEAAWTAVPVKPPVHAPGPWE